MNTIPPQSPADYIHQADSRFEALHLLIIAEDLLPLIELVEKRGLIQSPEDKVALIWAKKILRSESFPSHETDEHEFKLNGDDIKESVPALETIVPSQDYYIDEEHVPEIVGANVSISADYYDHGIPGAMVTASVDFEEMIGRLDLPDGFMQLIELDFHSYSPADHLFGSSTLQNLLSFNYFMRFAGGKRLLSSLRFYLFDEGAGDEDIRGILDNSAIYNSIPDDPWKELIKGGVATVISEHILNVPDSVDLHDKIFHKEVKYVPLGHVTLSTGRTFRVIYSNYGDNIQHIRDQ